MSRQTKEATRTVTETVLTDPRNSYDDLPHEFVIATTDPKTTHNCQAKEIMPSYMTKAKALLALMV